MVESTVAEVAADLSVDAALLSVVADPIRLGLLHQLTGVEKRRVCDLQADPPIPGNLLSYHLRVLRDAGLVTSERRGRWVDYSLAPDALVRLHATLPFDRTPSASGCCGGGR